MRLSITLLLIGCPMALFALDFTTDTLKIQSTILREERTILLFKPASLNLSDSNSIIYLLDGESSAYRYRSMAKEEQNSTMVGIGIVNTNRNRDLLPAKQPGQFLAFIEKELIPAMESGYKIKQRILFGHSFAGGFTIYVMLNKPGLFDKYIASSPTPIVKMIDPAIYLQLDQSLPKSIEFFLGYGSKDLSQVKKWSEKLNDNLLPLKLNQIAWETRIFEGENHNTSDLFSLKNGLE